MARAIALDFLFIDLYRRGRQQPIASEMDDIDGSGLHQEHHHQTEHIAHHAARSLIFPLPAPGAAPKKAPLP